MNRSPSARRLAVRLFGAIAGVSAAATVAYGLLLSFVSLGQIESPSLVSTGSIGGAVMFAMLATQSLFVMRAVLEIVRSGVRVAPVDPFARHAVYAAPRRAAGLLTLVGLGLLAAAYVPFGGPVSQDITTAASVGSVCVALSVGVLYAVIRLALRPLVETLREEPGAPLDLDGGSVAAADRAVTRVTLAVAIPAAAAALVTTLLVSGHLVAIANDQDNAAREDFNAALAIGPQAGESGAGIETFASALQGASVRLQRGPSGYSVRPTAPSPPARPIWSIPIALVVAFAAGQLGRRIGQHASIDLETAARRMAVVAASDIRSVTMSMARPRSIPEIRQMALALDTLAATLLRMADDQRRALTARTEAARVRSFVLASGAHDLRGPLNSVLGFGELILSGAEGPITDAQRESLDALARGGRDLLRLVGDLLDHARIDAGRMTVDRRRVSLDPILEQAQRAGIERSKSPVAGEQLAIEGEAGLEVVADAEQLAHALGGLTAFVLLRPGGDGRVTTRVRREGGEIHISIRGGGSTPTREVLQRMFEPFDFAPAGARAPAGLNLALSVARGILRLHGGTVSAEPADDGGVALGVMLPAAGE